MNDHKLCAILDEDSATADATTAAGWFGTVYETAAGV